MEVCMGVPKPRDLVKWREDIEMQLSNIDSEMEPLIKRRAKLREQLEAIERLISSTAEGADEVRDLPAPRPTSPVIAGGGSRSRKFTPVDAYWRPTLESLEELGGSGPSNAVIEKVGGKMEKILKPADRELLSSGVALRWHNRVAWQRENMKRLGLIRADSPRGIWEITEKGRAWLANDLSGVKSL